MVHTLSGQTIYLRKCTFELSILKMNMPRSELIYINVNVEESMKKGWHDWLKSPCEV